PHALAAVLCARAHAHQVPATLQLVARERELELALREAGARVADRLPGAAVPDHDRAAPILSFGDHALEARVLERVVLHLDRHATLRGVEARPLGHGPALQHAIELEPEVVVHAPRGVLLHHEREAGCALLAHRAACGFGRAREIALAAVLAQRAARGFPW